MARMSVAKAREILGKINIELSDKEMEDIIRFLYQMAEIELEIFHQEMAKKKLEEVIEK